MLRVPPSFTGIAAASASARLPTSELSRATRRSSCAIDSDVISAVVSALQSGGGESPVNKPAGDVT